MKVVPKGPTDVVVAGMSQAGSTLCFNLVREMYTFIPVSVTIWEPPNAHTVQEFANQGAPVVLLSKQHDLPSGAALSSTNPDVQSFKKSNNIGVLRVRRDLRDAVASRMRKERCDRNFEIIKEYCDLNISWHKVWEHIVDYDWVYEKYKETPLVVMRELRTALNMPHTDEQLIEVVHRSENLKHFYGDKERYFLSGAPAVQGVADFELVTKMREEQVTNNGVVGAYKDFFSEDELAFINATYGDWLRKYGYAK